MREVVITGIGMRTPLGNSLDAARAVFASGQPVVRGETGPLGEVRALARLVDDPFADFPRVDRMMIDPAALLAMRCADEAIADSGLDLDAADRNRIGVFVGSGQGAVTTTVEGTLMYKEKNQIRPFTILRSLGNGMANHISMRHHLYGESLVIMLACAASNAAIGNAYRQIRDGYLDAALAGGVEAPHHEVVIRAWEAMRVLAKVDPEHPEKSSRPFAGDRTGLVLGEGGVLYMLEEASQARARGARIYARIAGFGVSSDGAHIAHPEAEGQAKALIACLREAGAGPADIGYINAHGTATPTGDPAEVESIGKVLGSHAQQVPVSSTKSLHGHLLGAAGAIELLAPLVALRDGIIAPTANLEVPDPAFNLDFVPNVARTGQTVRAAVSSNFAFGGSNACLLLTQA